MYQVLARKYRPKNFHELLGQDHVAKALTNAINQQRLHHAYLFTGTRGVGKTTIARILAKCLNCETGITSEPCGVCNTCQAIDAGRFIDLIEIDAASRTKVEDTRELLDNVPYAPTQGRYKVYLIDEVHMLSTHSFNALLKTLEEPPEHVKFLLATTDPQKLPITIVSRCLQFVLRPLPQTMLADYLAKILQKEAIDFESDALWQLASSAKGSVRDALSLTDQAIAFGNGQIGEATLTQMLGLIDQADVIGLIGHIYHRNLLQLRDAMQQLRVQVVDAKAVFDSLSDALHQIALLQLLPDFDLQVNRQQADHLTRLAQTLPAELVQLYYEIVLQSRERIALANTPLQALEMCLLRLLAFKPVGPQQIAIPVPSDQTDPLQANQALVSIADTPPHDKVVTTIAASQSSPAMQSPIATVSSLEDDSAMASDSSQSVDKNTTLFTTQSSTNNSITKAEETDHIAPHSLTEKSSTSQDIARDTGDSGQAHHDKDANDDNANDERELPSLAGSEIENNQPPSVIHQDIVATANLTPTEPAEKKTQEVSSTSASNDIISAVTTASPLALLVPTPQLLEGEWTTEKWDYWVYEAREQGWLDEDELVLAKRGLMQGEIQGHCVFITHDLILSQSATFENFCKKLKQAFNNIQISLDNRQNSEHMYMQIPEKRQENREILALNKATEQVTNQSVIQALMKQNATVNSVKLIK